MGKFVIRKNMNILITGANGQLGNELKTILMQGKSELGPLPPQYKDCQVTAIDVDVLDITDPKAVASYFSNHRFEIVFNCAAMTNVDSCETKEDLAYKINANGPENLAKACAEFHSKFVHVSTDYVFSGIGNKPFVENDECAPDTAYGRTKLSGEHLVMQSCRSAIICRTAWLYGYVGNNFVKTMMRLGRENGVVKVVNDQIGNPTCAVDLAFVMVNLAVTDNSGIFHATCNGPEVSWYEFATSIMQESGIKATVSPCTTKDFPRPAKRPAYSALQNKHLQDIGMDIMRPWDIALHAWMANYLKMEQKQ